MAAAIMTSALTSSISAGIARQPAPRVQSRCTTSAFFRPRFNGQCQPNMNAWRAAAGRYGQGRMSQQDLEDVMRVTNQIIKGVSEMVETFSADYTPYRGYNRRSRSTEDGAPASSDAAADAGDMPLAVDVAEDSFSFTFTADVPGVQRSAVKVQARKEERELVISGERSAPEQLEEDKGFRRRFERRFGKFSRTFTLPENAELTGITARFENGVLTVRVPKSIPVEPEVTDIPIVNGVDGTIDI